MKRLLLILVLLAPALAFGQKQPKPNINKALNAWKQGKLDEAKQIIDQATTYEKTKDDGNTWYYRGLIYATLDTTSNEAYKSLAPNAFETALESFEKAESLREGNKPFLVTMPDGSLAMKEQQISYWAAMYLNKGAEQYQEDDLENALQNFEKVQKITPKDTTGHFYAGFVANNLEQYEKAIDNFRKYIDAGGTSPDAYSLLYNMYTGPLEDNEKALAVAREAKEKFPNHPDFGKLEIGVLINMNRIDEAKSGLEAAIKREPDNKILHYFLGYANSTLGNSEEAVKNYQEALRIDPKYFEAQLLLAKEKTKPAAAIKKQMNDLGITAADRKKKLELDKVLVTKLKDALPYWEQAEKLNPSDQEVLDQLYEIYANLDMQQQVARIEKRYKELGLDN